jgi:hypothetical protein
MDMKIVILAGGVPVPSAVIRKVDMIKDYFMDYYIYESDITVDLQSVWRESKIISEMTPSLSHTEIA